ncbi:MAG: uroporphyrinogen-III C-methyltransferase [Thiobacillaceae bacterium]
MNEPTLDTPAPRHRYFNWAIPLGILAIVLSVAGYLASRDQARNMRADLSQKLAEFQNGIREDQLLTRGNKESSKQIEQRLTELESQISTSKEQQLALDVLYKELSRDRDQWALAEIEQILLTVNQQLQLAGNVKAAILGLEMADSRLERKDLPQFIRLRAAIARDLAQLRGIPQVDYTGLSIRLNNLVVGVDTWPLVSEATVRQIKKPESSGKFHNLGQDMLSELKDIVQIRRLDQGEPALLTPEQEYFLRQNLKLRLLSARLSLLNRDESNFVADITAIEKLLDHYFNERDDSVASARQELAKLSRLKVSPPLPGIEGSLTTLQQLRQVQ